MPNAASWDAAAQAAWNRGDREGAIRAVLALINGATGRKPLGPILQLSYYLFLAGDMKAAADALEAGWREHPEDPQVLLNLAVCLSRSNQPARALERIREYLQREPDNAVAHDTLCAVLHKVGRLQEAAAAGTRALELKDRMARPRAAAWSLPAVSPGAFAAGKPGVIAFGLWGAQPRYVRGALDNALSAKALYPGWRLRFHVDDTVPAGVRDKLVKLGADLRLEPPGQPVRQRLAWRFKVANDPGVGRFMVRDVDSVVNPREREAVDAWIASDRWFHVMRDWWTHTDLVLAGMWGGVAGVLPDLMAMLQAYRSAAQETPNIDQWFLRDQVWAYLRESCLVHDRCFSPAGALPWPSPPPGGNTHVGQDEHAVRRAQQEARLAQWL